MPSLDSALDAAVVYANLLSAGMAGGAVVLVVQWVVKRTWRRDDAES